MTNASRFYQKNGLAVIMLSRDLLNLNEGERMLPIAEYEQRFGFSRWTIQTAIKFLVDNECVKLDKRGPMGSYAHSLDYGKLWRFTGWDPLLGVAPLPSSHIHDALQTGLSAVLSESAVPFNMSYMLPASRRFNALAHEQCHFILTSELALRLMKKKYPNIDLAVTLTGSVYCEPYYLYLNCDSDGLKNGMRVAIYDEAIEQSFFSREVCKGFKVTKVNGTYHDCQNRFENGEVDAHVQRGDVQLQNVKRKISLDYLGYDEETVTPVLLANKDNYGIEKLLARHVNVTQVAEIEQKTLSGEYQTRYF